MKKFLSFLIASIPFACSSDFKTLDPDSFENAIRNSDVQVVDVRTPEEFSSKRIPNSINIDIYNESFIDSALVRLNKDKPVAVYCRTGRRSASAANALVKQGFKNVINLEGGIFAWLKAGKKTVSD